MGEIVIEGVTRIFGGGVRAVDDVSLTIQDGEFLVLVGPSGCGKTTLLRMIAGLEDVSQGSIHIGSDDVTDAPARQRDIAMVFQNYALYPHMSVRENLAFCLKMQKVPKQESRQRVAVVAEMLGLGDMLERKPAELSGGQRQRVAMGRAIVREPKAFLMDEPLSNLDAKLRVAMRTQLVRLHERLGTTTVYVTHDQVEAMTLGHRVAVMRNGRILQIDTPQAIYARPENLFVAAFIGSPSMNLVEAEFDGEAIEFAGFRMQLDHNNRPSDPGTVIVGIRPEAFEDWSLADPALPQLEVVVEVLEELGSDTHLVFPVDAPRVETEEIRAAADGENERLFDDDERTSLLNARVDPSTSARAGEPFKLSVNPRAFHFFDPSSGVRLDVDRVPASA